MVHADCLNSTVQFSGASHCSVHSCHCTVCTVSPYLLNPLVNVAASLGVRTYVFSTVCPSRVVGRTFPALPTLRAFPDKGDIYTHLAAYRIKQKVQPDDRVLDPSTSPSICLILALPQNPPGTIKHPKQITARLSSPMIAHVVVSRPCSPHQKSHPPRGKII